MNFSIKKALLAGTAIIAVGAFTPAAHAADEFLTDTNDSGTFTTTAPDETADTGLDPSDVSLNNHDLRVVSSGIIAVGTTSGTIGDASATIAGITAGATGQTLTIDNTTLGNDGNNETVTIANGISRNGFAALNLLISGEDTDNTGADTLTIDINGDVDLGTGTITVNGDAANANNDIGVSVSGNLTSGTITLNGGAADAILTLDGTAAQTVTGNIAGSAGAGTNGIKIDNAAGVTFSGIVGQGTALDSIIIEKAAGDSAATFQNTVNAPITLGGAGTGTNTVTFDGTTADFTVTGAIAGAISGEIDNIVVTNTSGTARTVTLATASTSNLDNLTVSGTGTTLATGQNLTVTNTTIDSGATLSTTANTVTSDIANSGVLALNGGSVVGTVTGTGLLDVNTSGTVTGAITQGTADIAAATLTQGAASGYTVGTTNFSDAGTLALLGGNQTVTGNFTNTTDGQGTVSISNVAGTTAIAGNLGAGTDHSLAAFNILGAAAQTVTTTGNLFVDATTIDNADTLKFIGTSGQTVSGTVSGGNLIVGDGTNASDVTFNGVSSGLASAMVAAKSTANLNANTTTTGTYTNTGTTVVGSGATLSAATLSDTGSYVLNLLDADGTLASSDFGSLTDTGGAAATLTASNLSVAVTGQVGTGTVQLLTHLNTGAATLSDNSIQYSFTTADNGNNTDVTVARESDVSLASEANKGVAGALDSNAASTNTELAQIGANLATASSEEEFNNILEASAPTSDGGAVVGGFNASVQSIDVTETRLASLRNGTETGMVAGEMSNGLTGWVQGFGQRADQDERDGIDGYQADTFGLAVGLDTANLLDDTTLGVAFSYANTDVDSKNINDTEADVDSYQFSLYGDYDITPDTYVSGTLAYARNSIDQTRHDVGAIAGLDADSSYDSDQYIAYVEAGHDYTVAEHTTLTPNVLAHYQHINIDDYTENGAGGANLNVESDDLDILEFGVGAELAYDYTTEGGSKLRPSVDVGYRHDVIGDSVSSTSNFTGGGASFQTDGLEPAEDTFNVGAALTYQMDNSWSFTADYDYELKADYDAHSGSVRANYKF